MQESTTVTTRQKDVIVEITSDDERDGVINSDTTKSCEILIATPCTPESPSFSTSFSPLTIHDIPFDTKPDKLDVSFDSFGDYDTQEHKFTFSHTPKPVSDSHSLGVLTGNLPRFDIINSSFATSISSRSYFPLPAQFDSKRTLRSRLSRPSSTATSTVTMPDSVPPTPGVVLVEDLYTGEGTKKSKSYEEAIKQRSPTDPQVLKDDAELPIIHVCDSERVISLAEHGQRSEAVNDIYCSTFTQTSLRTRLAKTHGGNQEFAGNSGELELLNELSVHLDDLSNVSVEVHSAKDDTGDAITTNDLCSTLDSEEITYNKLVEKALDKSVQEGSIMPLLKKELQTKIQMDRLERGEGELVLTPEEPKTYQLTPEEIRRRNHRIQQNRRCARKIRLKKRQMQANLDEEIKVEIDKQAKLRTEIEKLKKERETLQRIIARHKCIQNIPKPMSD